MQKSTGHIAFFQNIEFFLLAGEVYQVDTQNPFDVAGFRMGARWLCSGLDKFAQFCLAYNINVVKAPEAV